MEWTEDEVLLQGIVALKDPSVERAPGSWLPGHEPLVLSMDLAQAEVTLAEGPSVSPLRSLWLVSGLLTQAQDCGCLGRIHRISVVLLKTMLSTKESEG